MGAIDDRPRFSGRLAWETGANDLSCAIEARRAAGAPILDLTESNPTRVGLAYPEEAIRAALADPRALCYEPDPCGSPAAREAVAAYYRERDAPRVVDPAHVILSASTSEGYAWLFKLLADPGDAVLVPQPSYPLFDFLAALEAVHLVPYPLGFDGHWYLDLAALQHAIDAAPARPRAIVVVNPNNPTGTFLKRSERAALSALARERGLAIVCDEVFADYPFAADLERVDTLVDEQEALAFSLSGLSKVTGLPQLKLGWVHVAGPPALRDAALARLELIADTYLSVATPVQLALPALLSLRRSIHSIISSRVAANRAALQRAVAGTACQMVPAEGGWYAMLRLPATRTDERWAIDLLEQDGVLVQPGYFYDLPLEAHLVLSLLPPEDRFTDGIGRIVARVAESA
jgi:aspartate/methionine/tyrosine aminotransferase